MAGKQKLPRVRYGIAELYGKSLLTLTPEERLSLVNARPKSVPCPFRERLCTKNGGVCSMRLYREDEAGAMPVDDAIVTMCPQRFREDNSIFRWVGRELLGCELPSVVREVPFLLGTAGEELGDPDAVGQIDMVLIDETQPLLGWCALEIQSVYFSGPAMSSQFAVLSGWPGPGVPFPDKVRRPDFRSSGPKRLMPQLQIKVPTLRRWGKKMAVVIDLPFWKSLSAMQTVADVSNCDVAWFVVHYEPFPPGFRLVPHALYLTTLEHAVEGLTGGRPVTQQAFEASLKERLPRAQKLGNPG